MSAAVGLALVFAMAFVIPLLRWAAINRETSNPTVVDRAEAERIAKARGGRQSARSSASSDDSGRADRHEAVGWDGRQSTAGETRSGDDRRGF